MKDKISFLGVKIRLSVNNIGWLLSSPKYAALTILTSLLFFEFIYWLFNASTLWTIMSSSNVSFVEKMNVLASPFESVGQASGASLLAAMVVLAILQGISIASLTYIIRRQRKIDDRLVGGSSLITLLAIIGLGCPACGTSLVTPIVALFVSGSAVAVSEKITTFVTPIAILIAAYGIYKLGLQVANIRAKTAANKVVALSNVNDLQ